MKVLLLNPTICSEEPILRSERCQGKVIVGLWPPISLAYIAAVIKPIAEETRILDSVVLGQKYTEMVDDVVKWEPDLVVLQNTTPTIYDDKETARRIKDQLPKCKIAFIGLHATVRPEDIVDDCVDFSVRNDPEYTVKEIVEWMHKSGDSHKELADIKGLSYKRKGDIVNNPRREVINDLDVLPFPARDLLNNELYRMPNTREKFTLVKTSRGCPYGCIYCTASAYYGPQWKSRSAAKIVDEIEEVIKKYDISNFFLSSDTFNVTEDHVLSICTEITKRKLDIKWICNSRADNFSETIAKEMKRSGCWMIAFGIESGSDKILLNAKKGATINDARNAIRVCKENGIKAMCYFMFGLPGETKETIEETIDFALEIDPDYAHFYVATPFPGTAFFKLADENHWLASYDWRKYFHGMSDIISYPDLSASDLSRASTKAYLKFYFRPRKIIQQISAVKTFKEFYGSFLTFVNLIKTWVINK